MSFRLHDAALRENADLRRQLADANGRADSFEDSLTAAYDVIAERDRQLTESRQAAFRACADICRRTIGGGACLRNIRKACPEAFTDDVGDVSRNEP